MQRHTLTHSSSGRQYPDLLARVYPTTRWHGSSCGGSAPKHIHCTTTALGHIHLQTILRRSKKPAKHQAKTAHGQAIQQAVSSAYSSSCIICWPMGMPASRTIAQRGQSKAKQQAGQWATLFHSACVLSKVGPKRVPHLMVIRACQYIQAMAPSMRPVTPRSGKHCSNKSLWTRL